MFAVGPAVRTTLGRTVSRTGQGIELMFLGIGLGDQDVFINKAIAR